MKHCTIEIAGHDRIRFACEPGLTVLDAAAKAGWGLPYSCRRGTCESCRCPGLEGEVSPPADADGTALLCQSRALSDIRIAPIRAQALQSAARKKIKARLYRLRMAAPDVAVVDLRFPAGVKAQFKAGQYLNVHIEGEEARSFSMANTPRASDSAQLHVRVLPGSLLGERILPHLQPGDTLDIELPFGEFYLREGTQPVVLLAGGTGFAPMQAILEEALPRQRERSFSLYWGARQLRSLYAMEAVRKWEQKFPNFRFTGVLSDETAAPPLRQGLVHAAVLADFPSLSDHQVYACGAPPMIVAARAAFVGHGLAPEHFFSDAFAPASPVDARLVPC